MCINFNWTTKVGSMYLAKLVKRILGKPSTQNPTKIFDSTTTKWGREKVVNEEVLHTTFDISSIIILEWKLNGAENTKSYFIQI